MNGIDVSKYQKLIDWNKVDASGFDFALIRAGYGNDASQKDPYFDQNMKNAIAQGLHIGAYWFSYAVDASDAQKEAALFHRILSPYKGKLDFPVAFDYEKAGMDYYKKMKNTLPGNSLIDSMACAFMESMKSNGWFASLYTNLDFIKNERFSKKTIGSYDVWLADYSGAPDYPCTIQQTSSTGTVPGISGNVDIDISYKDYPTIIRAGGYNGYSKQPQTTVKIDTTMDITYPQGEMYTFATTCSQTPTITVGTANTVILKHCRRESDQDFWHLVFTGKSGNETGIYTAAPGEQPLKRFKARIA